MVLLNKKYTFLEIENTYLKITQIEGDQIIFNKSFSLENKEINDLNLDIYLNKLPDKKGEIILLVPPNRLYMKALKLPAESRKRLAKIVNLQFLTELPLSENELYYSYYTVTEKKKKLNVLSFAVGKNYLDKVYDICEQAELKVCKILPLPLLDFHLHKSEAESIPTLYVNKYQYYYTFIFIDDNNIYLRSEKQDKNLKEEIEKTHSYIRENFVLQDSRLQIKLNGQDYEKRRHTEITKKSLEIDNSINYWQSVLSTKFTGRGFLSCLKDSKKKNTSTIYNYLILITVVIIIIINLIGFNQEIQIKENRLAELQKQADEVMYSVNRIEKIEENIKADKHKLKEINQEINYNFGYLPWLNELSKILTEEVEVNRINFEGERLAALSVRAPSATAVIRSLKESPYFTNLDFTGSIVSRNNKEVFQITGELSYEFD